MATKKTMPQIVFAEFPDWSKLTKAERNSLYEQMCQLWKDSERDKATQLFDYLFEHGYDEKKMDEFAEATDIDFQFHYVRKLTDFLERGDFSKAEQWLRKIKQNDPEGKNKYDDVFDSISHEASNFLEKINQQIVDSFYEKNKNDPYEIFFGEQCAVLNKDGHIEFIEKDLCLWDAINGATGLILAKDKPVERSKFKMTGFSPELKAVMTRLSQDDDECNCYPNIIEYSLTQKNEKGEYVTDDFQTECETWKILMQLLAHGYSLVHKQEYTLSNSNKLPKKVHDQIEEGRRNVINSLMDDDDNNDDDDDLNLDDLNLDDEDDKPAKKSKKSKKK